MNVAVESVLDALREAEALLETLPPLHPDHETLALEIARLRATQSTLAQLADETAATVIATVDRIADARALIASIRDKPQPEGRREPTAPGGAVWSIADEAVVAIDRSGSYQWASAAALDLLGVSWEELRDSPRDRFAIEPTDPEAQEAFRAQWEGAGAQPIVGTTGIRTAGGEVITGTYSVEAVSTGYLVALKRVARGKPPASTAYAIGDVLREWRAAERRLADLDAHAPDHERIKTEIDLLRRHYHRLFSERVTRDRPAAGSSS